MNEPRDQFLARSTFTRDQNGSIAERGYFHDLPQRIHPRLTESCQLAHRGRLQQFFHIRVTFETRGHRRRRIGQRIPRENVRRARFEQLPRDTFGERFALRGHREHAFRAVSRIARNQVAQLRIDRLEKDQTRAERRDANHGLQLQSALTYFGDDPLVDCALRQAMVAEPALGKHGETSPPPALRISIKHPCRGTMQGNCNRSDEAGKA